MSTTPTPYDPANPLADEEAQLPSVKMHEDYQKKVSEAYTKHLADALRAEHPDIQPDATDAEVFSAVHSVETPEATPEEFWNGLGKVYGYSWKPPAEPNVLQQGAAAVGDIAVNTAQDVAAIPKGVVELGQGIGKLAAGQLQGIKSTAFTGTPSGPSDQTQEGLELIDKSKAHFARGGAFAAGLLAAGAVGGAVAPLITKLGVPGNFLGRLTKNIALGTADAGAFMGTYEGVREAAKTNATPAESWNAFVEGVGEGSKFGAAIGVGGTVLAPVVRKAWEAGVAASKASNLAGAKKASIKFADAFLPEWAPSEMKPEELAVGLIKELHGDDVLSTRAGARAATIIAEKIKAHRALTTKEAKIPQLETTRGEGKTTQAVAPNGELVWTVGIEENPGVVGIYNVTGPTAEAASASANELASSMGKQVKTEVSPQFEKRAAERRRGFAGPPEGVPERRLEERRAEGKEMEKFQAEAETELANLDKMSPKELVKYYRTKYPSVKNFPYKSTAELKEFLRRELRAQAVGSQQARLAGLAEELKATPLPELVEKIKTAAPEEKKILAEELSKRDLGTSPYTEEKPVDVSKASAWTAHLKETAAAAKADPTNVAALDAAFRAKQNFEAWKGRETAKKAAMPKVEPGQALMIGRGANGSVRVVFPSRDLADIYALMGRLRGSVSGKKSAYSPTRASAEIGRLSAKLKISRSELFDMAALYRKQINEFVKDHPTYEESGKPLLAPEFSSTLAEQATDPELIRKLAQKKQEGKTITKKDYTQLGKAVTEEIKKISQAELDAQYKKGMEAGVKIDNWKVVDLLGKQSSEVIDEISKTKTYIPLLKILQTQFNFFQGTLAHLDKRYLDAEFTGYSVHDHLGGNLEGRVTGSKKNHILINPWSTLTEVMERVDKKLTDDTPEAIADDLSGQLVSTLLHEISHQEGRTEAQVAGVFTRNVGHFVDILPEIKDKIREVLLQGQIMRELRRHRTELYLDKSMKLYEENRTAAEEGVNIHDYLPVQELGLEEIDTD